MPDWSAGEFSFIKNDLDDDRRRTRFPRLIVVRRQMPLLASKQSYRYCAISLRGALTVWQTDSFNKAFELAEVDAAEYAKEANCLFVRATDSYQLFHKTIGHGSEIFSLMRDSGMEPEVYADTFCCTPRDHARFLDEDPKAL